MVVGYEQERSYAILIKQIVIPAPNPHLLKRKSASAWVQGCVPSRKGSLRPKIALNER